MYSVNMLKMKSIQVFFQDPYHHITDRLYVVDEDSTRSKLHPIHNLFTHNFCKSLHVDEGTIFPKETLDSRVHRDIEIVFHNVFESII